MEHTHAVSDPTPALGDDALFEPAPAADLTLEPVPAAAAVDVVELAIPQDDTVAAQTYHDAGAPQGANPFADRPDAALAGDAPEAEAAADAVEKPNAPRALGIDPAVEERRKLAEAHWQAIVAAKGTPATFPANVTKPTNGGLLVDVGGVRGFRRRRRCVRRAMRRSTRS